MTDDQHNRRWAWNGQQMNPEPPFHNNPGPPFNNILEQPFNNDPEPSFNNNPSHQYYNSQAQYYSPTPGQEVIPEPLYQPPPSLFSRDERPSTQDAPINAPKNAPKKLRKDRPQRDTSAAHILQNHVHQPEHFPAQPQHTNSPMFPVTDQSHNRVTARQVPQFNTNNMPITTPPASDTVARPQLSAYNTWAQPSQPITHRLNQSRPTHPHQHENHEFHPTRVETAQGYVGLATHREQPYGPSLPRTVRRMRREPRQSLHGNHLETGSHLHEVSLQDIPPQDVPHQSQASTARLVEGNRRSQNQYPYRAEAGTFYNRAIVKLRINKALRWAHPQFFHRYAIYSSVSPCSYQLPGRVYLPHTNPENLPTQHEIDPDHGADEGHQNRDADRGDRDLDPDEIIERQRDLQAESRATEGLLRYMDVFRRKTRGKIEDRLLDPTDGQLRMLVVQATPAVYNERNRTTWRRTYLENISPYIVRLAYWPTAGIKRNFGHWEAGDWLYAGLRWLPSSIGLLIVMIYPTDADGQIRNNGYYDPFPYRFWSYPKTSRNPFEDRSPKSSATVIADRIMRPRMLCFLDETGRGNDTGVLAQNAWKVQEPTYVFISYTAEGQFSRRCKLFKERGVCDCETCLLSIADAKQLHKMARLATRQAGLPAYWTDECCMSTDDLSTNVYSISDVTRNAELLVILLGESGGGRTKSRQQLLVEWGSRMWTFPEVLLAQPNKEVLIYVRGRNDNPWRMKRMDLAYTAWEADRLRARELIDHYDNTLTLSRLELVTIALGCLMSRKTTIFFEGDLSYALMGLLRQRPTTDKTDSAFQAFARLSLANDSDKLLERMICLLPKDQAAYKRQNRHYWATMDDFWGAKLWDVDPICQIAAIGTDDTVIIDGAYAATIHWDTFQRVAITTKETWTRLLSRSVLRSAPIYVFIGVLFLALQNTEIGVAILIFGGIITLLAPIMTLHVYGGKVWNTQPWLFAFEGHMPIREIETKIFGFPQNRLSWTPFGSSLSEHRPRKSFLKNECRGIDPAMVPGKRELIDRGPTAEYGESRVFTLVDTNTMTVTLFEADRPPAVALLCGSEGGMQRAILCSYDWPSQTLYRETVLRMETRVLEKMSRVGRVSFGLRRNVRGKPDTWPLKEIETTEVVVGRA